MRISARISWEVTLIWVAFIVIDDDVLMDFHGMDWDGANPVEVSGYEN